MTGSLVGVGNSELLIPSGIPSPGSLPTVKLLFYLFPGDDDGSGSRSGNDRKWREALRSLWRLIPRAMLVKVGAVEV